MIMWFRFVLYIRDELCECSLSDEELVGSKRHLW